MLKGGTDIGSIPVEMGHSAADSLSTLLSAMDGPVGVASRYSVSKGTFWPLPKPPGKLSRAMKRKQVFSETKEFSSIISECPSDEQWVEKSDEQEEDLKQLFR